MTVQTKADFTTAVEVEDEFASTMRALDPKFAALFLDKKVAKNTLRELVYCVDHLYELMEIEGCPVSTTLMSPDTETFKIEAFFLFNELFRMTNNHSWKMSVVNNEVKASLRDFFAQGYLTTIGFLMDTLGVDELEFTIDRRLCSLVLNEIVPDSKLNVLEFYDFEEKIGLKIPFARSRAGHSLKVK